MNEIQKRKRKEHNNRICMSHYLKRYLIQFISNRKEKILQCKCNINFQLFFVFCNFIHSVSCFAIYNIPLI